VTGEIYLVPGVVSLENRVEFGCTFFYIFTCTAFLGNFFPGMAADH